MAVANNKSVRRDARASVIVAVKGALVRQGLCDLITFNRELDLVASVQTGTEFIGLCLDRQIDIGVIETSLPDMICDDLLLALKKGQCSVRVIVYADVPDEPYYAHLGAWACLSTKDEISAIQKCLTAAASEIKRAQPHKNTAQRKRLPNDLTSRERQLLCALSDGMRNNEIARRFGISQNTVKYHLKNLYDKLGVANRASAVARSKLTSPAKPK